MRRGSIFFAGIAVVSACDYYSTATDTGPSSAPFPSTCSCEGDADEPCDFTATTPTDGNYASCNAVYCFEGSWHPNGACPSNWPATVGWFGTDCPTGTCVSKLSTVGGCYGFLFGPVVCCKPSCAEPVDAGEDATDAGMEAQADADFDASADVDIAPDVSE